MTISLVIFAFVFGAVIGSFLNVVIYRLPAKKSIVYPPSSCPHCGHRLRPSELIPILSWALLRGRCKSCGQPISARYPAIEALTGLLFAAAAALRPEFPALLFIWAFIAVLIALSFIDIDTYEVPDALSYGGLALGLLAAPLILPGGFSSALEAALMAAGLLALINGYGVLAVTRGRGNKPEGPVGLQTLYFAAAVGAWLGPAAGLVAGFLNWGLNARSARVWAAPEALTLGLALLGPLVAWLIPGWPLGVQDALRGLLIAGGGIALAGGLYWAFRPVPEEDEEEVAVLGFGDVKLAGMLGAWVGFWPFVVGMFVAVIAGAVIGLALRERKVPFVPYLALGGVVALFFGQRILEGYLRYLGIS
ncbi:MULTISPECIES: A24 family peptidase [unclassified Meiothermus]|uniref:prepilin peptidase n=1 Tax=unclassified Meiothermus TaxID=370471 RepID=UPI000D7BF764|nr:MULTISPECIES: A24 family peptidase [unclassified Meiothermus]PZA07184.1 prepilin peptidase [Meiothermus sp. Pnk-1]RYM39933.1 prepilin peptidase [Meiothermus sp. PNK-Is4]